MCDVCCNLPYNIRAGEMMVHDLYTERGLWNEKERFVYLELSKDSMVMYVGANTKGRDGKILMDMFGCTIHIYEPVPAFSAVLSHVWFEYTSKLGYMATVHHCGLGSANRTVILGAQDIDGQGTFGMSSKGGGNLALDVRDSGSVVRGSVGWTCCM